MPEHASRFLDPEASLESDDDFVVAAMALVAVRRAQRAIAAELKDDIAAKFRAHRAATAEQKRRTEKLDAIEPILAAKLGRFLEGHTEFDGGELVVPTTAVPLVEGFGWSVSYTATCEDLAKLVRAAARKPALLELLAVNTKELGARAKRMREAFRVPGCRLEARVVPVVASEDAVAAPEGLDNVKG